MNNIYNFINDGLDRFSDSSCIYGDIKDACKSLNSLLNNGDSGINYSEFLNKNTLDIRTRVSEIFYILNDNKKLYINLDFMFDKLWYYQEERRITSFKNGIDDYRDHYFHSIQCFLLAVALQSQVPAFSPLNTADFIPKIFQTAIYHDLGYLYKLTDIKISTEGGIICNDIKNYMLDPKKLDNVNKIFCLFHEMPSKKIFEDKCTEIQQNHDIIDVWVSEVNTGAIKELRRITLLPYCNEVENRHSYRSAILLTKFLDNKTTIDSVINPPIMPDLRLLPENRSQTIFEETIKAIAWHGVAVKPSISFDRYLFECFFIIIDELQTYGRIQNDENSSKRLVNPADVGFSVDTNGKITLESSLVCKEHSDSVVAEALKKRIDINSLNQILNIS